MATGSVSAIDREEWQLIESKAASGTSVTFNAFSGYKHLWLTGKGIDKNASTYIAVRPNNDTTAGNYAVVRASGVEADFLIQGLTADPCAASFQIFNVDKTTPKKVNTSYGINIPQNEQDAYIDTVAVTSLVVYTYDGTTTFTGGTFYLYGIVA
jgi:hypothetical protein